MGENGNIPFLVKGAFRMWPYGGGEWGGGDGYGQVKHGWKGKHGVKSWMDGDPGMGCPRYAF